MIRVNEIFGPTHQGEGPSLGQRCVFVRLAGCNLDCAWCDTPYTWDWTRYDRDTETHPMTVSDVHVAAQVLADQPGTLLVISGGEPMLQQAELLNLAEQWDGPIEIETNGTITPRLAWHVLPHVAFNVSPKLDHARTTRDGIRHDPLRLYRWAPNRTTLKIVVATAADLDDVDQLVDTLHWPRHDVYLMPEGIDSTQLDTTLAWLAPLAATRGYNLTTRLHVHAYGNTRGR